MRTWCRCAASVGMLTGGAVATRARAGVRSGQSWPDCSGFVLGKRGAFWGFCSDWRLQPGGGVAGGVLPGVSAPGPTHFLCWCKESKQRKHLEEHAVVVTLTGRCAPGGDMRCSRKVLLDTQGSRRTQRIRERHARHGAPHRSPRQIPKTRCPYGSAKARSIGTHW
jgi:hypothetical protein